MPIIGRLVKYECNKYVSNMYEMCIAAANSINDTCMNLQKSPQYQAKYLE